MRSETPAPVVNAVHYAGEPDKGVSAMVDLETLPSLDLSGLIKPRSYVCLQTQRGCPFKCAFCQHKVTVDNYQVVGNIGTLQFMLLC